MRLKEFASLLLIALIVWVTVAISMSLSGPFDSDWYAGLQKPFFQPPAWLFGPVWTLLYLSIIVATWLVWRESKTPIRTTAMVIFVLQLVLNALWTPLFFGWQQPGWALIEILFLWAAIVAMIFAYEQVRRAAGLLLLPYLGWVSFALVLNFALWRLNSGG